MALLSLRAYGAKRGVSGEAVRKAIADGRIKDAVRYNPKNNRPMVDEDIADREWVRNTDGSKQTQIPKDHRLSADAQPPGVEGKDERLVAGGGVPETNKSRAISEAYKARLLKLEYEQKIGKLVPIDQVADVVGREYTNVRQRLLSIPSAIAKDLMLQDTEAGLRSVLEAAINDALQELVGNVTNQPD